MRDLGQNLRRIVDDFVSSVLRAIEAGSLSEFAVESAGRGSAGGVRHVGRNGPAGRSAGRRRRSTADEVQQLKDVALEAARELSPGFRKGDVMKQSGSRVDLGRALSLLVKEGKLSKKGDRRKARYWVS
jgi:hypothetical protein